MQIISTFVCFAAAISFSMAGPLPADDAADGLLKRLTAAGYNFTTGYVEAGLSKRQDVPEGCGFEGNRGSYRYVSFENGDFETCCMGWQTSTVNCGTGYWPDPDWTDIQLAMSMQVTKDGQFETSMSGSWTASFFPFTTAFSNRNGSPFILGLLQSDIQSLRYYLSVDGDYATVSRNSCP